METTEITFRLPRSWAIKLASLVELGDYPSMNAMMLELIDEAFIMPREEGMGERIDEWWNLGDLD